jgi:hypothetical protein
MQVHLEEAAENRAPSIQDERIRCPKCRYSLRGLPARGHCPECGEEYIYEHHDAKACAEAFVRMIPPPYRLWLEPMGQGTVIFHGDLPFLATGIVATAIAILFIAGMVGAAWLAWYLPWVRTQLGDSVVSVSLVSIDWKGAHFNLTLRSAQYLVGWLVVGQMLLALFIRSWYTVAARQLPFGGSILQELGKCAGASAPVMIIVPAALICFWQIMQLSFRGPLRYAPLGPFAYWLPGIRTLSDAVYWLWVPAVTISGAIIGLKVYRMHRRCIAKLVELTQAVRLTSTDKDGRHSRDHVHAEH